MRAIVGRDNLVVFHFAYKNVKPDSNLPSIMDHVKNWESELVLSTCGRKSWLLWAVDSSVPSSVPGKDLEKLPSLT